MYQWRKTIEKVVGGRQNLIAFFLFTTSSCIVRVPCAQTQKREKLVQM